jgi:type II secretory pathway pseudopilin PulG
MKKPSLNPQSGQTLIETITALFILSMALVAGLSLAIYSSMQSTNNRDRIIASNLAREGIELVRMLRDSNWLAAEDDPGADDLYETNGGCTYDAVPANNRPCYPEAFDEPYDMESSNNANDYRLLPSTANPTGWVLDTANGQEYFLMCLQADGTYRHNVNGQLTCDYGHGRFARRVTIGTGNIAYPYTPALSAPTATGANPNFGGHSPEKVITSAVVWEGRGCTPFPVNVATLDPISFVTKCKVLSIERLTNWKDYR